MAYTIDLNDVAAKFKEPCCFTIENNSLGYFGLYRVHVNNVYFKIDKKAKVLNHIPIFGHGYTIEEAAKDYFKKAKTGVLYHALTNQTELTV